MMKQVVEIGGIQIHTYSINTIIVGSGAAGLNAADSLHQLGQTDVAIVTEGMNMGTSRNTGSDKQTYYKLGLEGGIPDSVRGLAETLFSGGSMHGDIALVEAALSAKCFYKLAEIGVPFPHNQFGEYVGYKTDHDPGKRATSAGPLTSKYMTECLEGQVRRKGIPVFDGYRVIAILTNRRSDGEREAVGLLALNLDELDEAHMGFTLFNCTNIIYAVGGPAGMYLRSVYPESQTGAAGIAFEAGVRGVNLTESQYGIASTEFRWNLSGTYQQVIPRYVSTNPDGSDEREFLNDYFKNPGQMADAIFLKGYQWPFDPRKIAHFGSSLIDILVYTETQIKRRSVYLDFARNPESISSAGQLDFSLLGQEAYAYLEQSGALFGTPIDRLRKMNQPAVELYARNGIDLSKDYVKIDVCAQHNNGGLAGNMWWESNIRHFFPVGEAAGTFGVYRPGGSALNSTQVGSFRAAQYIHARYQEAPPSAEAFCGMVAEQVEDKISIARELLAKQAQRPDSSTVFGLRDALKANMTKNGAFIRSLQACREGLDFCIKQLQHFSDNTRIGNRRELPEAFINWDMLVTQFVYLTAIQAYIEAGGQSRGSYLIRAENGELPLESLPDLFRFTLEDSEMSSRVCEIAYAAEQDRPQCRTEWKPVRPIPDNPNWFENVWNDYTHNRIVR